MQTTAVYKGIEYLVSTLENYVAYKIDHGGEQYKGMYHVSMAKDDPIDLAHTGAKQKIDELTEG